MSNEKDQEGEGGGEKNRLTFIIVVRVGGKSYDIPLRRVQIITYTVVT